MGEEIDNMMELWSIVDTIKNLEVSTLTTIVNVYSAPKFDSNLTALQSRIEELKRSVDVKSNEVFKSACETVATVKLAASSLNLLRSKDIKGLYRKEVEAVFNLSASMRLSMKALKPLVRQKEVAGRLEGLNAETVTFHNIIRKGENPKRRSVFESDWPFRHLRCSKLLELDLLENALPLRKIAARAEATQVS